ncbi:MAG: hypothetical protein P1U58_15210, partial [Verrucomicrobiales bacterium]|nr:hypothetical protein [Verrucomicrobiales bacterium]
MGSRIVPINVSPQVISDMTFGPTDASQKTPDRSMKFPKNLDGIGLLEDPLHKNSLVISVGEVI